MPPICPDSTDDEMYKEADAATESYQQNAEPVRIANNGAAYTWFEFMAYYGRNGARMWHAALRS